MLQREHTVRLPSTFRRAFFEERRALIGWATGLAVAVLLELALFPTVRSNDMSKLLDSYPESVKKLFDLADFTTGTGYVRAELFSLVVPLLLVVLGILWGSDAIAGEEERRTIDLLLANPVSRRRVLLEKAGAVTSGLAAVGGVVLVALVVGDVAFGLGIGLAHLAGVVVATVLLAVLFATIALAIGAATGRRGLARGVTAALAVAAYLLSTLGPLVSWLEPWRVVSPWYHALGVDPLGKGLSPVHVLVLLVVGRVVLAAGVAAFERRDLAT